MLEDLLKAARDQVADRLASPLLGSFLVSWCLWNYKFLVILFSAATVSQTFHLIETVAFPDRASIALYGVLLPLLTAAAYIFAYPYPAKLVYGFTRRRQREILELRRKIEDETPLTIEDSRRIRAEVLQAEQKHREEIDRMAQDLTRAREELEKIKPATVSAPPKLATPPKISPLLESGQRELLRKLERQGGKASREVLLPKTGQAKVRTEFDLGELERLDLLSKDYDQNEGDYVYELTHEGRRVVIKDSKSGGDSEAEEQR